MKYNLSCLQKPEESPRLSCCQKRDLEGGEMEETWREGLMEKDPVCHCWRETANFVVGWLYDSFPQLRFGKMIVEIWKSHFYIWQEKNSKRSACTIWNLDIFGNRSAAINLDCKKNTIGGQLRKTCFPSSHFWSLKWCANLMSSDVSSLCVSYSWFFFTVSYYFRKEKAMIWAHFHKSIVPIMGGY